MEDKFYKSKENIVEKLDLPRDIVFNLPKINIIGNSEIIIENHQGVVMFDKEIVKINSGIGIISILGNNFEILFMGGNTVALSGCFKSIAYEGLK